MAATMTSEMADSARIVTLIEECRRLELTILPPDVNRSEWKFTLEDGAIRVGLGAVRIVGLARVVALCGARAADGPFRNLFDLAERVAGANVNKRVIESLVAAGACDALGAGDGSDRAAMFAAAGRALDNANVRMREREAGQESLFGEATGTVAVSAPAMILAGETWTSRERSLKEKEVLGFYFSEHPLEPLREQLARVATHGAAEVLELEDGSEVRLAGLVGEMRTIVTRSGRRMAAVQLEDLTGRIEATVFPDLFESARAARARDHRHGGGARRGQRSRRQAAAVGRSPVRGGARAVPSGAPRRGARGGAVGAVARGRRRRAVSPSGRVRGLPAHHHARLFPAREPVAAV
jgi:DNA polymerase-3 subunit alpha